jgi:hypothetical protein
MTVPGADPRQLNAIDSRCHRALISGNSAHPARRLIMKLHRSWRRVTNHSEVPVKSSEIRRRGKHKCILREQRFVPRLHFSLCAVRAVLVCLRSQLNTADIEVRQKWISRDLSFAVSAVGKTNRWKSGIFVCSVDQAYHMQAVMHVDRRRRAPLPVVERITHCGEIGRGDT